MPIIIEETNHQNLLMKMGTLFDVDFETGEFFWISPPKYHKDLIGKRAGCIQPSHNGKLYWVIQIDGIKYRRGRLMFLLTHGCFPSPCLDHINGNSLDDRPSNIREATITQNAWNHKTRKRKIKLPMGVRNTKNGNYEARISCNKKQIHLGCYHTPEEAHTVYMSKRKELYADFS
jgi:hypothetical protein